MKKIINVAIADDQLLFRECLTENLKQFSDLNLFIQASDGVELIDMIEKAAETPDVILMDLNMPKMNGLETTLKLREILPDTKIIVLSVHGDEGYVARMIQQGINGYMIKNSTLKEVYTAIITSLETGFYFNDIVKNVLQSGTLNRRKKISKFDDGPVFTNREKEILQLICKEHTTQEIADKLFLSIRTVDGHRNHLLEKTKAKNTAGLVVFALRNNLVEI